MEKDVLFRRSQSLSILLRMGLRSHNPALVNSAFKGYEKLVGPEAAAAVICLTITHLMTTENFSFELENGKPSLLL